MGFIGLAETIKIFLYVNERIGKRRDGSKKEMKKGTGYLHVCASASERDMSLCLFYFLLLWVKAFSLQLVVAVVLLLSLPINAPLSSLFHSKNLTIASWFGCSSSRKTAIMLLRDVNIPSVEFVSKYAMPIAVGDSNLTNSVKSAVTLSLPSSVVM